MGEEIPECINCHCELNYDEVGDRDTETMGGSDVEYLVCPKCGQTYSMIDGEVFCED